MDGQGQAEISMPEDNSSSLPGDLSPRQSKRWDRDAHINVVHEKCDPRGSSNSRNFFPNRKGRPERAMADCPHTRRARIECAMREMAFVISAPSSSSSSSDAASAIVVCTMTMGKWRGKGERVGKGKKGRVERASERGDCEGSPVVPLYCCESQSNPGVEIGGATRVS